MNPGDIEYDDEYDDTYDTNAIGETEPDAMEFVLPRALGGGHVRHQRQNGGNLSGDESEDESEKPRLDFLRNPEEIRQEAEQRRQSKMGRSNKKPHQQQNKDVVGNAKGQGQDKQVLINRARKNANKNKNHRNQADKKQSKGMF